MTYDKNYVCVQNVKDGDQPCNNLECRHNLKSQKYKSCALIAAEDGPLTLQEIGDFYGISRMRVCQIEKSILKKLKTQKNLLSDFDASS
tara:strand:- start:1455 stop:1721 length:267 start_codon:yes stop_codon:yes gene_type:complete